jgi:hypothetical protein
MRLEPDSEQLEVGAGVGVNGRQGLGTGASDLRVVGRDDFELGSNHGIYSDKGYYQNNKIADLHHAQVLSAQPRRL